MRLSRIRLAAFSAAVFIAVTSFFTFDQTQSQPVSTPVPPYQYLLSQNEAVSSVVVDIPKIAEKIQESKNDAHDALSEKIAERYRIPLELSKDIVKVAEEHSDNVFPSKKLLLAVMAVESSYRPSITNDHGASGLMQVIPKYHREKIGGRSIHDIRVNVEVGAKILREYYELLGRRADAAILAYNAGPAAYKNGKSVPHYLTKVQTELAFLSR